MNKKNTILLTIIFLINISCHKTPEKNKETMNDVRDTLFANPTRIAGSITYDVVLKNPEPTNEWAQSCLKDVDRETLTNILFDAVLSGKATAYDFSNNTPYSVKDIKKLLNNNEFKENKIAMIQFEESWYFDIQAFSMKKRVNAITLGYETYNSEGKLRGYKSIFKVYINNPN